MKIIKKIVFWQVSPSIHQAPYIKYLTKYFPGVDVICVLQRDINKERKALGWSMPDYGNSTIIFENNNNDLINIYDKNSEDAVHVFSSIIDSENIRHVYKYSLQHRPTLIGYLSEGYDGKGLKGLVRKARREFYEKYLIRHLDFVLSIGSQSYKWFERCGVSKDKIFPFPYVVESETSLNSTDQDAKKLLKIIFIGALIKRKNVSLLLTALSEINNTNWQLDIIGTGPKLEPLMSLVNSLGMSPRVNFKGAINNTDVVKIIKENDLLVLPSLWDGWGAVVNEALSQGVQVICSDQCGASELIVAGYNGDVFDLYDKKRLVTLLSNYIERGSLESNMRLNIISHSKKFDGEAIANYLRDIIYYVLDSNHIRPDPPWRK